MASVITHRCTCLYVQLSFLLPNSEKSGDGTQSMLPHFFVAWNKLLEVVYRGSYMGTHRYEIFLSIQRDISRVSCTHLRETLYHIECWTQEIFHIFKQSFIILFIIHVKYTDNNMFDILWRFPTTSWRFTNILQNFSKTFLGPHKHFQTLSENFMKNSKISEGKQSSPKTFKEDPKMFWAYTKEFKYNWKAAGKNVPKIFLLLLKVLKYSRILAHGLWLTCETLLWSFFRWIALHFGEIMYVKNHQ